jgi:uncharacterized protein (TIGR02996 family)
MPKCFVIMPYGGKDEKKREHYLGVYDTIIRAAAIKAGIPQDEIKRSDIAANPGNIVGDIVRDLYEADIVIADLSEGNANVFWELGVRHVLFKAGTVTIINSEHSIPFDLTPYRMIQYDTSNFASVGRTVTAIAEQIRARLENNTRSDNAVHDTIGELPTVLASAIRGEEVAKLTQQVNDLRAQNERLMAKMREIDPFFTLGSEDVDARAMLEQANRIYQKTGKNMLLQLADAKERGEETFIAALMDAVQSEYLSPTDFLQIRSMCKEMGLEHHQRTVLEIASKRFPYDDSLRLALIDAYDDAASFNLQERGRLMIEDYMGVVRSEDGTTLRVTSKPHATPQAIGLLYNFYLRANQNAWIISVSESLEELLGPSSLISRNKARAYGRSGQEAEALAEFRKAISLDPTDDTAYIMYADYTDDLGKYAEAYELFERAFLSDPNDGSRLVALSRHISLRGYVRVSDCTIQSGVQKSQRIRYVMPLLIQAIRLSQSYSLINSIIRYLVAEGYTKFAQDISEGRLPQGDFDTSALDCLMVQLNG